LTTADIVVKIKIVNISLLRYYGPKTAVEELEGKDEE
jgi:hypothetical protein